MQQSTELMDHKIRGALVPVQSFRLKGFVIAGTDHVFRWANAVIEDDTVVVSSSEVPAPVAVRYAWAANPDCKLCNKQRILASPFRTDGWPGVKRERKIDLREIPWQI